MAFVKLPYRVIRDTNTHVPGGQPIRYEEGDVGTILDPSTAKITVPPGCYYVTIPEDRSSTLKTHVISKQSVELGTVPVGKWKVVFDVDYKLLKQPDLPADFGSYSLIIRAAGAFFGGARVNQTLLPLVSDVVRNMTDGAIMNTGSTIRAGIHSVTAALLTLLETKMFTLDQIMQAAVEIQPAPQHAKHDIAGIYAIVHWDADGNRFLYLGNSINVPYRFAQHIENAKRDNTPHYRIWRKCVKHRMFLLCRLSGNTAGAREQLYLAELFFIAMGFQTFVPWLTKHDSEDILAAKTFGEVSHDPTVTISSATNVTNQNLGPNNPPVIPSATDQEPQVMNGNFLLMRTVASGMLEVAKIAMTATGWPGGCVRSDFGVTHGLNVSTPLSQTEHTKDPIVYTKVNWPGIKTMFTRPTSTVRAKGGQTQGVPIFSAAGSARIEIACWPPSAKPPIGTEVFVVIEIMEDNRPHPYEWARLPDLPGAQDWNVARSLGIAIIWREGNTWQKKYVQASLRGQVQESTPLTSYVQAVEIVRSLRQETLVREIATRPVPLFLGLYAPALVMSVQFDWLKQELQVRTKPNVRNTFPAGPYSRQARNRVLINDHGAQGVGTPFPRGPDGTGATCDFCYVCRTRAGGARAETAACPDGRCMQGPGTGQSCTNCWKYGIDCSWNHRMGIPIQPSYWTMVRHKAPSTEYFTVPDAMIINLRDPERME